MKVCARCQTAKPESDFYRQTKRPDGLHMWCKACSRAYNRSYIQQPDVRERRLTRRREREVYSRGDRVQYLYGLSPASYEELLGKQDGRCAICRTPEPGGRWNTWHVDHDHRHCPGKRACEECVRGLLCTSCNVALGHFNDDPQRLVSALMYLGAQVNGPITWWVQEERVA